MLNLIALDVPDEPGPLADWLEARLTGPDLGTLADQGTPLASELNTSASAVGREFTELTPFAKAARTSLIALGNAGRGGGRPTRRLSG